MKKPAVVKEHPPTVARRLYWLEKLIDEEYEGKPSLLEQRKGVRMAQVGQWFSGHRMLRDKALATLAEKTGKPEEWFERQPDLMLISEAGDVRAVVEAKPFHAGSAGQIQQALEVICQALSRADNLTRLQLEPLFSLLAKSEKDTVHIAQRIALLLSSSAQSQHAPDHREKSSIQVDSFNVEGAEHDGTSDSTQEQEHQTRRGRQSGSAAGKGKVR
jgi:hypothetical protein